MAAAMAPDGLTLFDAPSRTMERLPPEGSVPFALRYALVSVAVYFFAAYAVLGVLARWQFRFSIERFGSRDGVGRVVGLTELADSMLLLPISTAAIALATPLLVLGLARALGSPVAFPRAVRAASYASVYLIPTAIPLLGLALAPVAGWALAHVGPTGVARRRAMTVGLVFGWLAVSAAAWTLYRARLSEHVWTIVPLLHALFDPT